MTCFSSHVHEQVHLDKVIRLQANPQLNPTGMVYECYDILEATLHTLLDILLSSFVGRLSAGLFPSFRTAECRHRSIQCYCYSWWSEYTNP